MGHHGHWNSRMCEGGDRKFNSLVVNGETNKNHTLKKTQSQPITLFDFEKYFENCFP